MSLPKKNTMTQVLFLMVDAVDFATIRSGLTAMPTGKFYGVNHNSSGATTSGALSKTISHVRSGLYRATIKTAEANYDFVDYRFIHASAADQHVQVYYADNDDSDLMSTLTLIQSMASDAASAAQQANSRVLLNLSRISDIASFLVVMSGMLSDVDSALSSQFAAGHALDASTMSDLRSAITVAGALSASDMSDLRSAIAAGAGATVTASDISDIASAVWAFTTRKLTSNIGLNTSDMSDLRSAITAAQALTASDLSDLRSAITAVTATLSVSDISDIASAVWAHTMGTRVDSTVLLLLSLVSDMDSALTSQYTAGHPLTASDLSDLRSAITAAQALTASDLSDLRSAITAAQALNASDISDLRSAIAAGPAATVTASDISDIASAVWAFTTRKLTSSIGLNASDMSDLRSAIAGVTATLSVSDISDIASAVWANTTGAATASRVLLNLSRISDVASYLVALSGLLSDVDSALSSQFVAGVQLNASSLSDLRSAITAGGGATLSVSDISDIASAVRALLVSDLSDILSAAQQGNSRALALLSLASDIDSALTSQYTAGVQLNTSSLSDIRSAITAAAVTLDASTMSDIASQVWAHAVGARVDSRVLLNQSRISDVQSYLVGLSGMLSDTHSAAAQANSRALATFEVTSDIYSLLSDVSSDLGILSDVLSGFESDFQSRFPATIPELTGDPGATPTWAQAEALIFGWLKNDTMGTPTKRLLKNDAGTTVLSGLVNWNSGTSVFSQGRLG